MSAPKLKKCRGLYTASNRYDVPEGALVTANNILILKDGVIQPRWGLVASATSMVTGNVSHWHRASELNGTLWYAGRDTTANLAKIGYASPSAFAGVSALSIATEDSPDGYASAAFTGTSTPYYDIEFLKVGNLLYYNCARGLVRVESTTTQRIAGNQPCAVSCFPRPLAASAVRATNVTTVTTTVQHGYAIGVNVTTTGYGTTFTIATVPSATTFTIADPGVDGAVGITAVTATNLVGSSGFMATNDRVAYRACLVEYDTNGAEYTGEVSGAVIVSNASPFVGTAADKNVQLAILYPAAGLAANTKVELYRSKNSASEDPDFNFTLVYSKFLNTLDISRGYVWITDINSDTSSGVGVGKALYTNEGQDGLLAGNNGRPAPCKTTALWKDRLVQANTFDFPQISMQLKSVDSSSGGMAAGSLYRLNINSNTEGLLYPIASGTAFTTAQQFTIFTGGAPETDCKHTVLSMLDTTNWGSPTSTTISPLSKYLGIYDSAPGDWPGHFVMSLVNPTQNEDTSQAANVNMFVAALSASREAFAPSPAPYSNTSTVTRTSNVVTVDFGAAHNYKVGEYVKVYTTFTSTTATQLSIAGTAVEGQISSTTTNTILFTNNGSDGSTAVSQSVLLQYFPKFQNSHQVNNVRVSKPRQFEAFPPESYVRVGAPGAKILKCVQCKDSLMVFKEDGLYRVSDNGSLSAELVDPNAILWAKDSAVAIGGVVMAWLTKGVAIINENGVEKYVSKQRIDDRLAPSTAGLVEPNLLGYPFTRRAQAFVDEKNNSYELRVCFTANPSVPYASTVNLIYNLDNDTWVEDDLAVVSEAFYQGNRYIQQGTSFYAQSPTVYAGVPATVFGTAGTINATTKVQTFTYTGTAPVAGTFVQDTPGSSYYVLSASGGSGTLYSPSGASFTTGGSDFWYSPVISTMQWAPITFGEENKLKMHRELQVLFGVKEILVAELTTSTELITTTETVTHKLGSLTTNAGVNGYSPYNLRQTVPQQHRVAQQLSAKLVIRCATFAWTIVGIGCDAQVIGPRVNRGNR
jgi:hypothetical protein